MESRKVKSTLKPAENELGLTRFLPFASRIPRVRSDTFGGILFLSMLHYRYMSTVDEKKKKKKTAMKFPFARNKSEEARFPPRFYVGPSDDRRDQRRWITMPPRIRDKINEPVPRGTFGRKPSALRQFMSGDFSGRPRNIHQSEVITRRTQSCEKTLCARRKL